MHIYVIPLNSSHNEKRFRQKLKRKSKHTLHAQQFPFPKIVSFMRQCGKILYSQTGHTSSYNATHGLCILG